MRTALNILQAAKISATHPAPNRDYRLPNFRPSRDFWGPKINQAAAQTVPPKPVLKPATVKGGKGGKGAEALLRSAYEIFIPPPSFTSGASRPAYIGSMTLGGLRNLEA